MSPRGVRVTNPKVRLLGLPLFAHQTVRTEWLRQSVSQSRPYPRRERRQRPRSTLTAQHSATVEDSRFDVGGTKRTLVCSLLDRSFRPECQARRFPDGADRGAQKRLRCMPTLTASFPCRETPTRRSPPHKGSGRLSQPELWLARSKKSQARTPKYIRT
jgi:hypothetical protein